MKSINYPLLVVLLLILPIASYSAHDVVKSRHTCADSEKGKYICSNKLTDILSPDTLVFKELIDSGIITFKKNPTFSISSGSVALNRPIVHKLNFIFDNTDEFMDYWSRLYGASIINSYPDFLSLKIIKNCIKKRSGVLASALWIKSNGEVSAISNNCRIAIKLIVNILEKIDLNKDIDLPRGFKTTQSDSISQDLIYLIPLHLHSLQKWTYLNGITTDSLTLDDVRQWLESGRAIK